MNEADQFSAAAPNWRLIQGVSGIMDTELSSEEERLVFVIRATNVVETIMKRVISAFIEAPDHRLEFVNSYLLNNSTMSFGAKVKLILAIAKELSLKVDKNAFHVLLSRRNAFAHQDHLESVRLMSQPDGTANVSFVVESIKSSGTLEAVTQEQAFSEFMRAQAVVQTDLNKLIASLEI